MTEIIEFRQLSPLVSSEEIIEIKQIETKVSLIDLIKNNDKIVLLGEPGSGKSFELDNLFKEVWKNKENSQLFPFFITLKKYHSSSTFEELIPLKEWINLPNILFILDGLDETAYPHDFISVLEIFINKYRNKNLKFVISSRTNIYFNHQLKLDSFKPYKLESLELNHINNILKSKGVDDFVINQEFVDKHPFYTNPFFLVALIKYYKESGAWLVTENEIWEYYVDFELNQFKTKQLKKHDVIIPLEKQNLKKVSLINELQGLNQIDEDKLYKILSDKFLSFIDNPFIQKQFGQDKIYSFIHRQYQEYFAALVLKELSFEQLKSVLFIENLEKVRPGLNNITMLILSLAESDLFRKLSSYLIDHDIEIILKSDSLRLPRQTKNLIFIDYFTKQCIDKTLWIGTNSAISDNDLAQFADSKESFEFLIKNIRDEDLNVRARVSAINLIEEFKNINEDELINTIQEVLDSDDNLSFKSTTIRMMNTLSLKRRVDFLRRIIDQYPDESNKQWNRSLLAILIKLDNIDEFFDYLEREYKWSNKIVPRKEIDTVHRGNSWLMMELVLRLNNESNFLKLITFYFNDYNLMDREIFKENIIKKCIEFESKNENFTIRLIEEIRAKGNLRTYSSKESLIEIIAKTKKELEVFKLIFDSTKFDLSDQFILAKISTESTIDFLVSKVVESNIEIGSLDTFRNILANSGKRGLAHYFEQQLSIINLNISKSPTEQEIVENQSKLLKEVQVNFELIFDNDALLQKIETTLSSGQIDIITAKSIRNLERTFYEKENNWFRGLGCEFDILFAATNLFRSLTFEDFNGKLQSSKRIQLIALRGMLGSNKSAQFKFEINSAHIAQIKKWICTETESFEFHDLIQFNSSTEYTISRPSDFQFLKTIYFYFEIEEYENCFNEDFLLNSIIYYRMEESQPFSKHFDKLIDKIQDKKKLKERVIENIKAEIFTFPKERLIIYALNNNITEVSQEIGEFLESSSNYPGEKIFDLFKEKHFESALEIMEKISFDLSGYKGWSALKELTDIASKQEYCLSSSKKYLSSGFTEFKSNALTVLFKLNDPEALNYFIDGIGMNPLYNIAHKYRANYSITFESFINNFDKLFIPIYQTRIVKDEFDRDWEFTENNTFFTQLISNELKESDDKAFAYEQLNQKLIEVQEKTDDDRIIFFANSIIEFLSNNYLSLMSQPMSFEEAHKVCNEIING